jgi:valyl-tRNA synthetase
LTGKALAGFVPRQPNATEPQMIENRYQPGEIEARIAAAWEQAQAFRAGRPERRAAKSFCIVIPPPNVTGSLHMGHALNNTLQDVLCRFERMRGRDVLWQPGTDHAGIATQMVVERQMMERQEHNRQAIGRKKFLEKVWQWKAESGGIIINQLKRLGASCDWSRERFTMGERGAPDEQMVRAVLKAFVELYHAKAHDGKRLELIYKDKRLVNWDTKLLTAISDLEVQQAEVKGHLWYIRYPIEGKSFDPNDPMTFIVVATTRPETMLGDTAVAVHPDDERYKALVGKNVIVPLSDRVVPIVADEYSDPGKGTGAVKITPAHDFNDFEVWRRHQHDAMRRYPPINILSPEGTLLLDPNLDFKRGDPSLETQRTIVEYNGMDRFAARKKIVTRLEELHLIEKIEPHTHTVPHGDRSGTVIEPFLTDQWYVKAKELARSAIDAVRDGRTVFVPTNWEKTYFEWMENIQPWCISRQLWWGHQIPVWYGFRFDEHDSMLLGSSDRFKSIYEEFVATSEEEALDLARKHYRHTDVVVVADDREALDEVFSPQMGKSVSKFAIWRDPDVLDTWFSSALWPFSTLGWPDETPELKRYYPTDVLITGFDIIFFWVARMMMMGLHFMKEAPFSTVYIHPLVRDEKGAKMSKSKGNVIDPLHLIDEYGADALRFTLAAMAAQGRDIKLSTQRVEGYRNFATKLWNACRFAEMNGCVAPPDFDPQLLTQLVNQWIVTQLGDTLGNVEKALDDYRFNDAANSIYHFVWNSYCDWYLEFAKPVFVGLDDRAKAETRATVAYVRDQILKILHPFMPFITEELWRVTAAGARESLLALAPWPTEQPYFIEAQEEVGWLIDLVSAIRSVRAEINVPPGALIPLVLVNPSDTTRKRAEIWDTAFNRLARVSGSNFLGAPPQGAVQLLVRGEVAALPLKGVIDFAAERARLGKELAKVEADIKRVDTKLTNANFLANAPEEIVEGEREKREEAETRKSKIIEALERLKGAA